VNIGKSFYAKNRREWRAWLAKNHKSAKEIWLIYYKKASGKPRVPYNDAVEEALCYGWIDSLLKPIDEKKYAQRYSPRKATSKLSDMNRERVRRLIASKRMTKAGLASIAHAFDVKKDTVEKLAAEIPADILRALKKDAEVWRNFRKFPASYKRIRVGWITAARERPQVLGQRLNYFLKMTKQNKRFGMVQ
jgi:uncharacterized protein YdeI (YjbR/CyaY-like superfamily)